MFTNLNDESLAQFRALYFALSKDTPYSALLDSCGWQGKTGGFYMMGFEAEETQQLKAGQWWHNGEPIALVENKIQLQTQFEKAFPSGEKKNYGGFKDGWVGVLAYELNAFLETTVAPVSEEPPMGLLYFIRFKHRIVWHPEINYFEILSPDPAWINHVETLLANLPEERLSSPWKDNSEPAFVSMTQPMFESKVEEILSEIKSGNLYQANLSLRFEHKDVSLSTLPSLYLALVQKNPSPFSGVFWTPQGVVLSNSPERLVKYDQRTNVIETRPIAGTRGRGQTLQEDTEIGTRLQTDPKELAEHWMLVDLERNDLGKVSSIGTVETSEIAVIEQYAHVTHLVSQVEGQKASDKTSWDMLEAMFPGGTITGCPKIRCMETLGQLETVPRWFYTGSMGYMDVSGNMDFNILIRSLFYWPTGDIHYHAGAGIVADSQPAWEYKECLRKAASIQSILSSRQPGVFR